MATYRTSTGAQAIVPHASTNQPFRSLYVGVSGDVSLQLRDNTAVLFKAVPVGILPVEFLRVNAVGTTATNMLGLN